MARKRHITLDCPVCKTHDSVVADPNSSTWICFVCRNIGTYSLRMIPAEGASITQVGHPAADETA